MSKKELLDKIEYLKEQLERYEQELNRVENTDCSKLVGLGFGKDNTYIRFEEIKNGVLYANLYNLNECEIDVESLEFNTDYVHFSLKDTLTFEYDFYGFMDFKQVDRDVIAKIIETGIELDEMYEKYMAFAKVKMFELNDSL